MSVGVSVGVVHVRAGTAHFCSAYMVMSEKYFGRLQMAGIRFVAQAMVKHDACKGYH